ncbi:MAG: hypothetical protein KIT40_02370 [Nitrospira sp.]|nr:hypothetical protein [Nitrospira sp.]
MRKSVVSFFVTIMAFVPIFAHGFKLDPYSQHDQKSVNFKGSHLSNVINSAPVHEDLTLKAIAAARINSEYKSPEFLSGVIRGVRWNDDPLSYARGNAPTFYFSFVDSCDHPEEVDPSWDLLYRTHCGDMQFLHAMASTPSETSETTRKKIMMWLEFSFKVASGEIDKDWRFRSLAEEYKLGPDTAQVFNELMTNNGSTRLEWQPEWLFTLDCGRWFTWKGLFFRARLTELTCADHNNKFTDQQIQDIALGSFLHLIQDSFSRSHVLRERSTDIEMSAVNGVGRIIQFGNYLLQDQQKHGKADLTVSDKDLHQEFDLTDISAKLIEWIVQQRADHRSRWQEAKDVLDKVFEVADSSKMAGDIGYK